MKFSQIITIGALLLSVSGVTHAQTKGLTRSMVNMDRDTFLAMFRYDELMSAWVLKSGMELPKGVVSREEVVSMRDKFLSMNRWDDTKSDFVPVAGGVPRNMSMLSREQVQMETIKFLMTHYFDENSSQWVSKMSQK